MPTKCVVLNCKSYQGHKGIFFHRLGPIVRDKDRLKQWSLLLGKKQDKLKDRNLICSLHFDENDYNSSDLMRQRTLTAEKFNAPRLLPGAIPHRNLDIPSPRKRKKDSKPKPKNTSPSPPPNSDPLLGSFLEVNVKNEPPSPEPTKLADDPLDLTLVPIVSMLEGTEAVNAYDVNTNSDKSIHQPEISPEKDNNIGDGFAMVYMPSLLLLFNHCQLCGSQVLDKKVNITGTKVVVQTLCKNNHKNNWDSQSVD